MKKGFLLLASFVFLLSFRPVAAGGLGYNIVNNFFDDAGKFSDRVFQEVAANNSGATITLRLTSCDLDTDPELIGKIERAVSTYGLDIIWQPEDWEATTPERFRDYWLPHLSTITQGKISLFVEYNYHYGHPDYYADILRLALSSPIAGRMATTNFNTTNPSGLSSPYGETMWEYKEFLREVSRRCNCLDQIPNWAVSFYGNGGNNDEAVADIANQYSNFIAGGGDYGVNLGAKTIIIPEAGLSPAISFGERWDRISDFTAKLEQRLGSLRQSGASILFMDDETGEQYIVSKGGGSWQPKSYTELGIYPGCGGKRGSISDFGCVLSGEFVEFTGSQEDFDSSRSYIAREIAAEKTRTADINKTSRATKNTAADISIPGEKPNPRAGMFRGYMDFYFCEENVPGAPQEIAENDDKRVYFKVPAMYPDFADASYELGDMMTMPNSTRSVDSPVAQAPLAPQVSGETQTTTGGVVAGEVTTAGTYPGVTIPSCETLGQSLRSGGEVKPRETPSEGKAKLARTILGWFEQFFRCLLKPDSDECQTDEDGNPIMVEDWRYHEKKFQVFWVTCHPNRKITTDKYRQDVSLPMLMPEEERDFEHGMVKLDLKQKKYASDYEQLGGKNNNIYGTKGDMDATWENYANVRLPTDL